MALTEAQRVSIRFYLGWSARFHQTDTALEQAMNAVDALAETETQIEAVIADLDSIWARIKTAYDRLKAQKLGEIILPMKNEVAVLRSEGRRNAGALAAILGVEVRNDVFGNSRGQASSYFGPYGGNLMLQG